MIIYIKNLRLRTTIGIEDWERIKQQDVIINLKLEYDGSKAAESDQIEDTIDYKAIKHKIINLVENSEYYLLDRLVHDILGCVMDDERILKSWVEVDKPQALRFADSVSISCQAERDSGSGDVKIF